MTLIKEIKDRLYPKPVITRPDYSYGLADQPLRQRTAVTGTYLDACEYYFNLEGQNGNNSFPKPTTTTVKSGNLKRKDADGYQVVPADGTYIITFTYNIRESNIDVNYVEIYGYMCPTAWQFGGPITKFSHYSVTTVENLKKGDKLLSFDNTYDITGASRYQAECRYTFVKIS